MIRVAVNGFGTIGRRVADAITLQDDMLVVGIAKTSPDYIAKLASTKYRIFVPDQKGMKEFEDKGIKVEGTVESMIEEAEIVVDATPEGIGEKNLATYKKIGIKAVFQGGEEAGVAQSSFNAYANYDSAWGKDYVRVVSCNTTGLARTISTLRDSIGVSKIYATLVRRATDQNDSKKGPINAVEPSLSFPSHHGPDLQTVIGKIPVDTVAVKVPTTLMHVHVLNVDLQKETNSSRVIDLFCEKRRIFVTSGKDGKSSTAQIMDYARELGRPRGDLFEIAIWKESVKVSGSRLNFIQAVHQESDVVPENVDAIRAMFELSDREGSIERTDRSLGIKGGMQ
ncbi:MAG: type II glyceraldehyde-3-phosphate dehydrogenase [Thermoplasmata archaeon]